MKLRSICIVAEDSYEFRLETCDKYRVIVFKRIANHPKLPLSIRRSVPLAHLFVLIALSLRVCSLDLFFGILFLLLGIFTDQTHSTTHSQTDCLNAQFGWVETAKKVRRVEIFKLWSVEACYPKRQRKTLVSFSSFYLTESLNISIYSLLYVQNLSLYVAASHATKDEY
jgi:hypothetical protein